MSDSKILQGVADRVTDKPFTVSIDYKNLTWLERLKIRVKLMPPKMTFTVKPITVGNFERIAPAINRIPEDVFKLGVIRSFTEHGLKHLDDYLFIIAVGLTNKKKAPSEEFLQLLKDEMSWQDISSAFEQIMSHLGTQDFIKSTILIKGTEILKVGQVAGEIIAPEIPMQS
jgi:hypothetical protein